jgi:hypothetical protein
VEAWERENKRKKKRERTRGTHTKENANNEFSSCGDERGERGSKERRLPGHGERTLNTTCCTVERWVLGAASLLWRGVKRA